MDTDQEQNLTISDLLNNNRAIYQVPDDRLYSVEDLLYNYQKFLALYLKDAAKKQAGSARTNLMVALAWYLALINRFHIDIEGNLWKRYSYKCPYCLELPCYCQKEKNIQAQKTGRPGSRKPQDISEWQKMIEKIYPNEENDNFRHVLYSKLDLLNSAFRLFMREKKKKQFHEIELLSTDHFVALIRAFNHHNFNIESEYLKMFSGGCYVCKQIPCQCNYFEE